MDEEVNRDKTGEADGMNLEVDSKDEVMQTVVDSCSVEYCTTYILLQGVLVVVVGSLA